MTAIQTIWALLFTLGLLVEGFVLLRGDTKNTLSWQVWTLNRVAWARIVLMPFWIWLTWHFYIEDAFFNSLRPPLFVDDIVITLVAVIVAAKVSFRELRV